jgi:uncharacterized protein YjbJ (UPF0337 family)
MPLRFFIANESLHRGLKERKITPARTLRCEDRIAGTARNVGGKVQEGVGRVTGDAKSQADGLVNQAAGAAQDFYGQPRSRGLCELRRYLGLVEALGFPNVRVWSSIPGPTSFRMSRSRRGSRQRTPRSECRRGLRGSARRALWRSTTRFRTGIFTQTVYLARTAAVPAPHEAE